MERRSCQVLIIGAGPGGYVAAIRAGQLGLRTIIVEGERAGGTCLIRGCIPSKAMIHAAQRFHDLAQHESGHMGITIPGPAELDHADLVGWKDGIVDRLNTGVETLLKANGVELVSGWATFLDAKSVNVDTDDGPLHIEAEHVIMAMGSEPIELPFLPFGDRVLSSRGALDLKEVPEHLIIVGGGYIGMELGITYRMLGSKVTVVEAMSSILAAFDAELRRPVEMMCKKLKIDVITDVFATGYEEKGKGVSLSYRPKDADEGASETLDGSHVLVTVGRRPKTGGCGIEATGVRLDDRGFIEVDHRCATNMRDVHAIGDCSAMGPMLAHDASFQGEMVAEIIAGKNRIYDPVAVPAIVFTEPEIIEVGLAPGVAKEMGQEHGFEVLVGKFPLGANGRALTQNAEKKGGFVRVVAREDDHRILGIQAVGSHVSELSGEFALALEMGAVLEDIAGTIHAHPTMTEMTHEAVLATLGHAIHSTN